MLGFYDYTVILTFFSVVSAVCGVLMASGGHTLEAVICLMLCGLLDMFDGRVARTKKDRNAQSKAFGIQIDSLSDLLAFGILPAVIGFSCGMREWYFIILLAGYVLCALIRLAYFNVTEAERQENTDEERKIYEGLPVTSAALIFPISYLARAALGRFYYILYASCIVLVAVLFVLRFKLKKPDKKQLILMLVAGIIIFAMLIAVRIYAEKVLY